MDPKSWNEADDSGAIDNPSGEDRVTKDVVSSNDNGLNYLMTSSVKLVENGRHVCLLCKYTTAPEKDWSAESLFTNQRALMQSHMKKVHLKVKHSVGTDRKCCPSCNVLYSSHVMFYDNVCITCHNYVKRVHEDDAPEYVDKFKQHHEQQQKSLRVPINENGAKRIIASESLSSFKLGDFLILTNPNFDLTISDEPYVALMLLYNLNSGKFIARIWNQTVEVGWAYKSNELEEACRRLFKQGKPCIGRPIRQYDKSKTSQDFLVSYTPIQRIVSKSCHKLLGKFDRLSCPQCQMLENSEVTDRGENVMEDLFNTGEEYGETNEVKKEVCEDDFSHDSIEPYQLEKEQINLEHEKKGEDCSHNIMQEVSETSTPESKPSFTYPQLILQALMSETESGLSLSSIISFISQKYPFYKMENPVWQNYIRHNLTLIEGFEKISNPKGGSSIWRMKEGFDFKGRILSRKPRATYLPRKESLKLQKSIDIGSTPGTKKMNVGVGEKVDIGSNLKKVTWGWGQLQPAKEQDESEAKVCPWCSKTMNSRSMWPVHRKFYHHYGVFQCPVCQFQCNFAKEIHEHMKTEAHMGKVYCQNCQQHFTSGEMESHYVMCATGCAICKKTFYNPVGLRDHRKYSLCLSKEERGLSEDKYSCERCGKQYLTSKKLRHHIFMYHEGGVKKPCLCSICGMSFKNYSLMYCHRLKVHFPKEFEKQCQKCGLKFPSIRLLKSHLQSHEAPKFKCSFCGKMLKTKINLESHEMAHRGEKPFQCSLCSASFTKKDRLDQHMKGAHKIAGPRGGKVGWGHGNKKKQGDM